MQKNRKRELERTKTKYRKKEKYRKTEKKTNTKREHKIPTPTHHGFESENTD